MGGAGGADGGGTITETEVHAVRELMRSTTVDDRVRAVDTLDSWEGAPLTPGAASVALRAAGVGFPWVPGVTADPSELFVRLTSAVGRVVDAGEFERAYMLCTERGRRAVLRALALRVDRVGLESVIHLLGPDGPVELLPAPPAGLLVPLLEVPGAESLIPALVGTVAHRGWSAHVAEMIAAMATRGLLDERDGAEAGAALARVAFALADGCDRRCAARSTGNSRVGDSSMVDPIRVERRRLTELLPVFGVLPGPYPSRVLRRCVGSADPRVSATAAAALVAAGGVVGSDRFEVLCRDPLARLVLFDGLVSQGREVLLPDWALGEVAVAEAELVTWLSSPSQMRCAPDEIEHRGLVQAHPSWGRGYVHLFGFRVNSPHWAHERGWMLGAAGPFSPEAVFTAARAEGFAVGSVYRSESAMTAHEQVMEITRLLCGGREDPSL